MSDRIAIEELIDGEGRDVVHRTYPNATTDQMNRTRTLGTPSDKTIKAIVRDKQVERQAGTLIYHDVRSLLMKAKDGPPPEDSKFVIDGEEEDIAKFTKLQSGGEILAYRVELE